MPHTVLRIRFDVKHSKYTLRTPVHELDRSYCVFFLVCAAVSVGCMPYAFFFDVITSIVSFLWEYTTAARDVTF